MALLLFTALSRCGRCCVPVPASRMGLIWRGCLIWRAGDPLRTDVRPQDMTWTIRCDDAYTVTAARVGGSACFGYLVRESDKCAPRLSLLEACVMLVLFQHLLSCSAMHAVPCMQLLAVALSMRPCWIDVGLLRWRAIRSQGWAP